MDYANQADQASAARGVSLKDYDLDESLGFLLKQVNHSLQRTVDAEMTVLDLTAMQWGPLMQLALGRCETAAELARCACSDTGATTRMLDRLESKGLIRRVRSAQDRRVIKLELTEEGTRASEQVPERLIHVMNQHTRGFTAEEIEQLKSLLRRMIANGASPA
ncbi:Multiple antibiotic resistance protein MarR [Pigmentiphaga humi]|uniref:Multiple antibiotic resistance protein MarR n=1 Tax=Pigmentiphaga humi TaxID=2478468 RepID=A0A3P4AZF7_9BURK|nr:MarR family transcriptional regulator [Pigmentiphaga humi]VCU68951.1 Multiple antibiotic resistance protein MarR [Pigmentiphaga humi]